MSVHISISKLKRPEFGTVDFHFRNASNNYKKIAINANRKSSEKKKRSRNQIPEALNHHRAKM